MYNRIRTYAACAISTFLLAACAPSPITKDMHPKTDIYTPDSYKTGMNDLILSDNLSKMGIAMLLELRKEEAFRSKAARITLDSLAVRKRADEVTTKEEFDEAAKKSLEDIAKKE